MPDEQNTSDEVAADNAAERNVNLDEVSVTPQLQETAEDLHSLAEELQGRRATDFTARLRDFEEYVASFNPTADENAFAAYEQLVADLNPHTERLLTSEYMARIRQPLTLLSELAVTCQEMEDSDTRQRLVEATTMLMVAVSTERMHVSADDYAEHFSGVLSDAAARSLHAAIEDVATASREPIQEYVTQFEGLSDTEIVDHLTALRISRNTTYTDCLEAFDVLLPERTDGRHTWEHYVEIPEPPGSSEPVDSEQHRFDNWEARVAASGGETLDSTRGEEILIKRRFFGGTTEHVNQQFLKNRPGYVRKVHEDGTQEVREVQVCTLTLKQYRLLSEVRGVDYGTAMLEKDRPVPEVVFDGRYDSIISITEMLAQMDIPPAQELDDGKFKIPVVSSGKESWLVVNDYIYTNWWNKLLDCRDSFEDAGFTYEEERARLRALEDVEPTVQDGLEQVPDEAYAWMDISRAGNGLYDSLEDLAAAYPTQAAQIREVQTRIHTSYIELASNYGSYSLYESIAAQRLLQRGILEDSPGWEEMLADEVTLIADEYASRYVVYRDIAAYYCDITELAVQEPPPEGFDQAAFLEQVVGLERELEDNVWENAGILSQEALLEGSRIGIEVAGHTVLESMNNFIDRLPVDDVSRSELRTVQGVVSDMYTTLSLGYGRLGMYEHLAQDRLMDDGLSPQASSDWDVQMRAEIARIAQEYGVRLEVYAAVADEVTQFLQGMPEGALSVQNAAVSRLSQLENELENRVDDRLHELGSTQT